MRSFRPSLWLLAAAALLSACGDDSAPSADAAPPDSRLTGTLSVGWTIMRNGAAATCADVGNPTVRITALPEGGAAEIDTWSCSSLTGTTAVAPGMYTVTLNLGSLAETTPMQNVEVIAFQDTNLGTVVFDVTADATLQFTIDVAGASGGNCEDEATAGAGITGFVLELYDAAGTTCAPSNFMVGDPAETYASNCMGATFRCIENDETVRVSGLVFGTYRLRVQGLEDATICYPFEAAVQASGSTNVQTISISRVDPTPDGAAEPLCGSP